MLAVLVSLAVYGAGLLAMLGCSALYNTARPGPRKELWRRLDHAAIFVMIAGTYTPFAAIAIGGAWGTGLLVFVWTVAAAGVVLKLLDPGRFETLSIAAYLLLGWTILVAIDPLIAAVSLRAFVLLAAGGILYSAGILFYRWDRLPYQPGDLARVRADGRRMPILRHSGCPSQLREVGGANTSRCLSRSSDLFEAPAVAVQGRGRRRRTPASAARSRRQYFGIELDQPRLAPGLLAGDQRRARAAERIEHDVAALARVPDRPLDQRHRLHRRDGGRSCAGLSTNQTSP